MKYIKNYNHAPIEILEEADVLIHKLFLLCGDESSKWQLTIGGVKERRLAEAKEIILRAKVLYELVKRKVS